MYACLIQSLRLPNSNKHLLLLLFWTSRRTKLWKRGPRTCRFHSTRAATVATLLPMLICPIAARRRMASSKMKRMKQAGCKDQEELEEDNEELFAELGMLILCFIHHNL